MDPGKAPLPFSLRVRVRVSTFEFDLPSILSVLALILSIRVRMIGFETFRSEIELLFFDCCFDWHSKLSFLTSIYKCVGD